VCQAGHPKKFASFVGWVCYEILAAKTGDPVLSPPAKKKADASERVRDTELAAVLSKNKFLILIFHQSGKLSQRRGQAFLSIVRLSLKHPQFNPADFHLFCRARSSYI
jgi:hypothetical protein